MNRIFLAGQIYPRAGIALITFNDKQSHQVRQAIFYCSGEMMYGLYSLSSLRSQYRVDPALNADDAITTISAAMNAEQTAQATAAAEPSVEERIAAALEFQNAMRM